MNSDIRPLYRGFLFLVISFSCIILKSQKDQFKQLSEKINAHKNNAGFDSALVLSDKLIQEARSAGNKKYTIAGYFNKASVLSRMGEQKEAVELYYEALKLCTDSSHNKQKAFIYNNLGVINYNQKNMALAKYYFKEEIAVKKLISDPVQIANSLVNLSAVHRSLREFDSSAVILNELKTIVNKVKSDQLLGFYHHASGVHYQSVFGVDSAGYKLDSAIAHYNKAIWIWKKLNAKTEIFRPLFNLGFVYHLKKDFKNALQNYLLARNIAGELALKAERVKIYGNLAEVYYDIGDHKNAADYFRKYIELKDSVQKSEISGYALKLDKQFQTEKNKELISQQKLEIAKQEAELNRKSKQLYFYLLLVVVVLVIAVLAIIYFNFQKRLEKETEEAKKKFFSNVVHEIRTPLSMIQAPLKVLKAKYPSGDDQYNIEIAERNITRLNELVNQMLDISKIESTRYTLNETFGDLELFFNQITANYTKMAAEKNIILLQHFNLQSKLAFFDKDALEKITGNLLSNAIKYTSGNHQAGIDV